MNKKTFEALENEYANIKKKRKIFACQSNTIVNNMNRYNY